MYLHRDISARVEYCLSARVDPEILVAHIIHHGVAGHHLEVTHSGFAGFSVYHSHPLAK